MVLNTGADVTLIFLYLTSNLIPSITTSALSLIMPSSSSLSSPQDMLYIRHGRSRVRHSNEKNHIRWGLKAFDNLTLDYEGSDVSYENETMILFGSDFWAMDNGSFVNQSEWSGSSGNNFNLLNLNSISSNSNAANNGSYNFINLSNFRDERSHVTTPIPAAITTTIKKKLAKKKIMASIKKNVDKGLEYLKAHKNLEEEDFTYQNDAPSISNSAVKKTEGQSETIASVPDTNSNNLPHSVPARLTVTYKEQQAAREEAEAQNTENIEKTVGTIHLGFDSQDDNTSSMLSQLFSDIAPSKSRGTNNGRRGNKKSSSKKGYTNHENPDQDSELLVLAGDDTIDTNDDDDSDSDELGITSNVYGTTDEDLTDLDEISRNNRLNLMKGRDVVTKFLQIVESQHLLGANCTAGTALNLGEGVVDQYAQDRFRVEAEVAVNRANMLTRIFKLTSPSVQASEHLLHASVLSMVEFDDDIFAAGNCFDWNQHPSKTGLFCPFAYRLPPPDQGASFAKDLAAEYHYLGNTSEWFFLARKNAEKVIARNEQYIKAYHMYSNSTQREADEILSVKYEDGRWSKPYYDCGGGNIWMLTYTVPFFGYENGTYFFKGTSGIDIDLRRVDIDQCPQRNTPGTTQPLNIFAGTDKCKQRTTMCEAITGLGFRRGSYKCLCRKGFYFPETTAIQKYFNGSILEEEYEKLMLGEESTYSKLLTYECLPCAEGCDSCEDASPCVAALNWPMRTSILVLACAVIGLLPPAAWFTFRYQQVKVVRAASPALLRVIALGAFFIYCTTIVMYPPPSLYTCTARIWLREIGFSLTYGALMLKTWRISVIFRVRSAKAVKITDAALLKRLGVICGAIGACLLVRTVVSPPEVVVGRTADDLKAFLCKTDWWDYTFTSMEVLFLAWGVRLCIMVRKAPSEFNESRFISMAIYNEFLLTCFLNVSMLFLQSPANPDLLYIIFFCHTQLTVTLLLGLIFGSKVYIVLRSGKTQENAIGLGAKSSGAKFNFRPQIRTFTNPSTATSSTVQLADTKLSDQEALEEIRQLSVQLQRIQELAPPRGIAVMTISSLLDGLKTTTHQLSLKPPQSNNVSNQIVTFNNDIQKLPQANSIKVLSRIDKSINTNLSGDGCLKLNNLTEQCGIVSDPPKPDQGNHSDVSFSDLKLKCMCSDDDNDRTRYDHRYSIDHIEDCNKRKTKSKSKSNDNCCDYCTTITKSPNHKDNRKFHSSCNLIQTKLNSSNLCDNHKSNDHFLICDTCKNKIVNNTNAKNNRSIELNLDSRLLIDHGRSKSHDDGVSFHSTDDDQENDDDDDNDDANPSDVHQSPSNDEKIGNSNKSKKGSSRNRKQDKLVLDLNDRSKYTKEVSV